MKNSVALILGLFIVSTAFGWGKSAHLIIGQLADQYLTPKTREEVKRILGEESLGEAGIWLDAVMNDKQYQNQDNWHYAYLDKEFEDNAVAKLNEFSKLLSNPDLAPSEKLLPLRAFIHIAGDIHNPIHCGYFKDHGGHKVKLTWAESGEKTELHKVWDSDILLMTGTSVENYVTKFQSDISGDDKSTWSNNDFKAWVKESQDLLPKAYEYGDKNLTKAYYEKSLPIVEERLEMAAVRLAYVLNNIFDPK